MAAIPSTSSSTSRRTAGRTSRKTIRILPQEGKQESFLASPADISVYGGAAGGGKSWALLAEPLRHVRRPRFRGVIFRRQAKQVTNPGGLWDGASELYPYMGGVSNRANLFWRFPSGSRIQFAHLEYEDDKLSWQGTEVPYIGFDELTHFTESQFWYLTSRARSTSGVPGYVRASTNPDALSWVRGFLSPWLDPEWPDPAVSGELRWMIRDGGKILWVPEGTEHAKSVTFIAASIFDNRILMSKDPAYLSWLMALPPIERARLLEGDWNIVEAGDLFDRHWVEIIPWSAVPEGVSWCRFWDMAGSKPKPGYTDPDFTAGVLSGIDRDKTFYVGHCEAIRDTPSAVQTLVIDTAAADRAAFGHVPIIMEQEPGSLSLFALEHFAELLMGYEFYGRASKGSKIERFKPFSAYAQRGRVKIVAGAWNNSYLNVLSKFFTKGVHDDECDATSGGFEYHGMPREVQLSSDDYRAFYAGAG